MFQLRFLRQVQDASNSNVSEAQTTVKDSKDTEVSSNTNAMLPEDNKNDKSIKSVQNKSPEKDSEIAPSAPNKLEAVPKLPAVTTKSPTKSDINVENKFINSSQSKQSGDFINDKVSAPEVPVLPKVSNKCLFYVIFLYIIKD